MSVIAGFRKIEAPRINLREQASYIGGPVQDRVIDSFGPSAISNFGIQQNQLRDFARGNSVPVSTAAVSNGPTGEDADLKLIRKKLRWGFLNYVTNKDVGKVHSELYNSGWQNFNETLTTMAQEGKGKNKGWMIRRYVKQLHESDPSKVKDFTQWLANGVEPETAEQLMRSLDRESWGMLMDGFGQLDQKSLQSLNRRFSDPKNRATGLNRIAAKTAYEAARAKYRRLPEAAEKLGKSLKLVAKRLPGFQGKILRVYSDVLGGVPKGFANRIDRDLKDNNLSWADMFSPANSGLERDFKKLDALRSIYN